jgi:SAM-dependent methyltransferase
MKPQVEPDHYFHLSYDTKERFCCYWHQIAEVVSLKPAKVLEIGIGNGFLADYLKKLNYKVVTMDIDRRLQPDLAGSILNIPIRENSYELVVACEILEHLPFEDFLPGLQEIFRVSSRHVILSLPDANRYLPIYIKIPRYGIYKKLIPICRFRDPVHIFNGEHYWEIGKKGYPLAKIIHVINTVGFAVIRTYPVFEFPYHRFFILRKLR